MASKPPIGSPWNPNPSKSSYPSSTIYNPFFIIHTTRTRFASFSCSSDSPNNARKKLSKLEKDPVTIGDDSLKNSHLNVVPAKNKQTALTYKSLFGKRALWRRILFASKKVRSIILLNVITLIYGIYLLYVIALI